MRYEDMKVAELKAMCDEQGIEYGSGIRKAELIDMLEKYGDPLPEVIESGDMVPAFAVDMTVVQDDIAILTERIDDALTAYGEFLVEPDAMDAMTSQELSICEAALSESLKAAEDARLQMGRDYRKPLDMANARYKELTTPVFELHNQYAEKRQELRRSGLEATYVEFCDANGMSSLPTVVPFDRLLEKHPQWMRRDANAGKAAQKVEETARKLMDDWGTLTSQRTTLPFFDEAEAEFFRSLDLSEALRLSERRAKEQAAIAVARAERDEVQAYRNPADEDEPRRRYRFEASLTRVELSELRKWKNQNNIGSEWAFKEVSND